MRKRLVSRTSCSDEEEGLCCGAPVALRKLVIVRLREAVLQVHVRQGPAGG